MNNTTNMIDDEDVVDIDVLTLSREERFNRKLARRPPIDHLPDGVVVNSLGELEPKFKPHDRIVVERMSVLLPGNPWSTTRVYIVKAIDEATGMVDLEDEERMHHSIANYRNEFTRIKLAPKSGDPFKFVKQKVLVEKKDGTLAPRKRGRPKGSKNRDKSLINQEKNERLAIRREKKMRKGKK